MGNFFKDYKEKKAAEDADYKKRNPDRLPTKFQIICRIIVGGYLLYLVYKMYRDGALVNTSGGNKILMVAAMVVFVVAGVYSLVKGIKAYKDGKFFDPSKDDYSEEGLAEQEAQKEEEEKQQAEAIEANGGVRPGSMASFARLTSASSVSEADQEAAYEEAKAANEEAEAADEAAGSVQVKNPEEKPA